MSLLIGFRNVGKKAKVSRMKRQLTNETAEVVRAMLSRTSSSAGVILADGESDCLVCAIKWWARAEGRRQGGEEGKDKMDIPAQGSSLN